MQTILLVVSGIAQRKALGRQWGTSRKQGAFREGPEVAESLPRTGCIQTTLNITVGARRQTLFKTRDTESIN